MTTKNTITLFLLIIFAFILFDVATNNRENSKSLIPYTPNSDCNLEKGEHTIQGSVKDLNEKTSSLGNTYFVYTVVSDRCEYSAFSWTEPPDHGTFTGDWDYNKFGKLQFTITSSGEADNLEDLVCQSYTDYGFGSDSVLDFVDEFGEV